MFESVLTDELSTQQSRLEELQEIIPLPEFLKFETYSFATNEEPTEDNTFCHYHFLSQITHRILINRIKETLFNAGECPRFLHKGVRETDGTSLWRNLFFVFP